MEEPFRVPPGYRFYIKSSEIAVDSPTSRFIFTDVNPANICTPAFGVDMAQDIFFHYPSSVHRGAGVLVFADSHAETRKWVDGRTRKTVPAGQIIGHSDSSPNNPDLKWIREHTTAKR